MAKKKLTKQQTTNNNKHQTVYKTQHRKPKFDQHEPSENTRLISSATEGKANHTPHMARFILLS